MSACSACSCSNSALFPYRGQECRHVSLHLSGRRWNRPQRLGVRERERARLLPHPSPFMQGMPPHPRFTHQLLYMTVFTNCSSPVVNNSDRIKECAGEISSRQLSFMTRLTSRSNYEGMDLCSSIFLPFPYLPLLVKYTEPFSSKVIGSIKPGDLGQS